MANLHYHIVKFNLSPEKVFEIFESYSKVSSTGDRYLHVPGIMDSKSTVCCAYSAHHQGSCIEFKTYSEDFAHKIKQMCIDYFKTHEVVIKAHTVIAYEYDYLLFNNVITMNTDIDNTEILELELDENRYLLETREKIIDIFRKRTQMGIELRKIINKL